MNDERVAFERWALKVGFPVERQSSTGQDYSHYKSVVTQAAWEGWDARAKMDSPGALQS